jgi:hypothetical protein
MRSVPRKVSVLLSILSRVTNSFAAKTSVAKETIADPQNVVCKMNVKNFEYEIT